MFGIGKRKSGGDAGAEFDWGAVPAVDPDEVERWFGCTDAKDRQLPFQLALQVHDELVARMTSAEKMDALALSEVRGGIKALGRFAKLYQAILTSKSGKGREQ